MEKLYSRKKDTLPDPKSVILGYPQICTVFMGKVILLMVVAIYYCRTFDQWSWVVLFFIPSPFCVERISTKSPIFIKFSQKYLSKFSIIWLARSDEVWIFFFFFWSNFCFVGISFFLQKHKTAEIRNFFSIRYSGDLLLTVNITESQRWKHSKANRPVSPWNVMRHLRGRWTDVNEWH